MLLGGAGNDMISGDAGNDRMTGGEGADSFRIGLMAGNDTITDLNFAEGDELLFLTGVLGRAVRIVSVADLLALDAARDDVSLTAHGNDVIMSYESLGNTYHLRLAGLADEVFAS